MDERRGCRSLLCDANGIIIAEMVYRCMICYSIHDYIGDVSKHYQTTHMNSEDADDDNDNGLKDDDEDDMELIGNNNNNYLTDIDHCDHPWDLGTNKYPINDKFEPITQNISSQKITNASSESCTRSGYIRCPVCEAVRCYTTLQRRYGQFTCVACYRFFKEFFMKPTRFTCPNLGECPLDVKSKCKACWILACMKVYTVDGRRKAILDVHTPIKSCLPVPTSTTKFNERDNAKSSSNNGSESFENDSSKIKDSHHSNDFKSLHSFNVPSLETDIDSVGQATPTSQGTKLFNKNGDLTPMSTPPLPQPHQSMTTDENDPLAASGEVDNCKPAADSDMLEENSLTMIKDEADKSNGYDSSGTSSSMTKDPVSNGKSDKIKKGDRRSKARVKNWCCLKCANCLADDCGTCINCLDRPKFGGPFVRKQRCIKKKCLEKIQSEA
ncbi:uncharacterized protein LOC141856962 [Brevipalpus obovatus]|uniref:uncharacterized protein LOC141856962 n=1 Tax=Brevipalpus obovatus TaxID=246614 RepID=UPI003D9EC570